MMTACLPVCQRWARCLRPHLKTKVLRRDQLLENAQMNLPEAIVVVSTVNADRGAVLYRLVDGFRRYPWRLGEEIAGLFVEPSCIPCDNSSEILQHVISLLPYITAELHLDLRNPVPLGIFAQFVDKVLTRSLCVIRLSMRGLHAMNTWRRLLRHWFATCSELHLVCRDLTQMWGTVYAMKEVGATRLYRFVWEMRIEVRNADTKTFLWNALHALRLVSPQLRRLTLTMGTNLPSGSTKQNNTNACLPILDHLCLTAEVGVRQDDAMASLLGLLGPSHRMTLRLGAKEGLLAATRSAAHRWSHSHTIGV